MKRYLTFASIAIVIALLVYPFESNIVPTWRVQIVDVDGRACNQMRVNQSWAHYSLYLDGDFHIDNRLSDGNGYVEFPARTTRAALPRRVVVPVIAHVLVIAHGSVGADSAVSASGIQDVAWLSYKSGKELPNKMKVEKCIEAGTEQALGADSP